MSFQKIDPIGPKPEQKQAGVGVIGKVLRILETIQASPAALNLREICQKTNINKATAYRMLSHLQREGYVFRNDAGNYSFGIKLLQLGSHTDQRATLRESAQPFLQELWQVTGETINLAVLERGEVLYLDVFESPHVFRLASKAGMQRPVYSTALGKSLAAFVPLTQRRNLLAVQKFEASTPHTISSLAQFEKELERVRHQGYAVDDEESVLGARCISAPVLNRSGEAIAAVSVAGPTTRIDLGRIPAIVDELQKACRAISARIGF
jgi:DNA-binding IclR family transcriptional regulator